MAENLSSIRYVVAGMAACVIYLVLPAETQEFVYPAFPVVAGLLAIRRARRETRVRTGWYLFGTSLLLFATADALYQIAYAAFPGPADIVYFLAFAAALLAAFAMRDEPNLRRRYVLRTLDASIIAMTAASVIWVVYVDPAAHASGAGQLDQVIALAYPVLGLALLAILASGGRMSGSRIWLIAGALPFIAGDLWYSVAALDGSYEIGTWIDLLRLTAYVVWAAASTSPAPSERRPDLVPRGWPRLLVTSSLMAAPLTLAYHAVTFDHVHVGAMTLAGVTISALVVARLEITQRGFLKALRSSARTRRELEQSINGVESLRRRNQAILDSTDEAIVGVDPDGLGVFANPAAADMLSYTVDELVGAQMHTLVHHSHEDGRPHRFDDCPVGQTLTKGTCHQRENEVFWRKDGTFVRVDYTSTPVKEDGQVVGAVVSFRDITKRVVLEQELRQSQKLEAIGQLAGGIAHDFNNLLSVIINYAQFVLDDTAKGASNRKDLQEIVVAANRAAKLTQQLLTFSRKDVVNPRSISVNEVVRDAAKMLGRTIQENIGLDLSLTADLWAVWMDPSQLEQILMNLAVNARDAMPAGGRLEIQTSNVRLSHTDFSQPRLAPGEYISLRVADSGEGIPPDVLPRIFDPFFTTKEVGQGTGLGLATIYGIVEKAGGSISVESSLGSGTSFRILLPRCLQAPSQPSESPPSESVGRGETILVAEDERAVLDSVTRILKKAGYRVLAHTDPDAAMRDWATRAPDSIDLLLTDMVMPGRSGKQLSMATGLPTLFMTGYAHGNKDDSDIDEHDAVVAKPFDQASLLNALREALESRETSSSLRRPRVEASP